MCIRDSYRLRYTIYITEYKTRQIGHFLQPVKVIWSKEGSKLPADRAIDDGTGYFLLMNVVPSDSGIYICTASDGISVSHQQVNITVGGEWLFQFTMHFRLWSEYRVVHISSSDTRPKVILSSILPDGTISSINPNEILEIGVGEILNIQCKAFGTPTPTVEWLKVGSTNTRKVNFNSV